MKVKKTLCFLFLFSLTFALLSCKGNTDRFTFNLLENDTYSIASKNNINYGETLDIPTKFNNKAVTEIADNGFKNYTFKTINIPSSISKIGNEAFFSCNNLTNINYNNVKQNIYFTFNDSPVGFDDNVECGANCFGDFSYLPSIKTADLVNNASFTITCNNINQFGNKMKYDIGYCKDTDIRSKGEFELDSDSVSHTINAKVHGVFKDAKFKILQDNTEKFCFTSRNIKVSANEYNIAPISGSFPVLLFSLQLKEITKNGTIPTYVAMERSKTYDWNNLMYNISYFPNVPKEEALIDRDWQQVKLFVSRYVKDLHQANSNSIYNFYYRDLNSEFVIQAFICNGVKPSNIKLHILSDGTLTPVIFNGLFGIKDGETRFDCNQKLNTMKQDISNILNCFLDKKWDYKKLIEMLTYPSLYEGFEGMDCMDRYSLAMLYSFSDSEFQTGRLSEKDNIAPVNLNDPEFCQKIINSCKIQNTNSLLKNLSDEEKIAFKKMYKFSDDVFKESKEKGNDIVMILGGAWSNEKNNFYAYLKMTMEYFGTTKTDYYYKPHPGHPTALTPDRQAQIKQLSSEGFKITELEGSIAAEIILFYEPTIQSSGWPSTTYTSLENNEKGLALYDVTLSNAKTKYLEYYKNFECFYSVAPEYLKSLHSFSNNDHIYLIEYNDSDKASERAQLNYSKHPTALYNLEKNEFHYYDKDGKEVEK